MTYYVSSASIELSEYHLFPSGAVFWRKKPLNNFWVAQMMNNRPEMQETWVWSLGQEDPLEKGIATHSSILAWRIPWTDEPGGLLSLGLQKIEQHWATNIFTFRYTWHTSVRCKGKELL